MKKRVFVLVMLVASSASARNTRRFEPNDLELTPAGTVEIDTQAGYVGGRGARVVAPDVEASIGINDRTELEVDTTAGVTDGKVGFSDQTWVSLRIGVVDVRTQNDERSWSAGVQVGPRLPTAPMAHGLGGEGVIIVGRGVGGVHLFGSGGFVIDSYDETSRRPTGIEGGLDFSLDLDSVDKWSFEAELGAQHFFQVSSNQMHLTAAIAYRVIPSLELSLLGLVGPVGDDRWGILLGCAPRFSIF